MTWSFRVLSLPVILFGLCHCASSVYFSKKTQELIVHPDGRLGFSKGPYSVYLGPGAVVLAIELPLREKAVLEYWPKGDPKGKLKRDFQRAWDRIHSVLLSGLGTKTWEYRIRIREKVSDRYEIKAGAEFDEPFKFLLIGDSRHGDPAPHRRLVRLMRQRKANFLIHLGDYVNGGSNFADWNDFFEIEQPLLSLIPIVPVIGNHDLSNSGIFTGLFFLRNRRSKPERFGAFLYGNSLFINLDTTLPIIQGGTQYRFLIRALKLSRRKKVMHTFVSAHHPIYSSGKHGVNENLKATLLPLLRRYGVRGYFSGHDHNYERTKPVGETHFIVSGGGGSPLRNVHPKPFTAKAVVNYHFVEIAVGGSKVHLKAINHLGKEIDSAKLN